MAAAVALSDRSTPGRSAVTCRACVVEVASHRPQISFGPRRPALRRSVFMAGRCHGEFPFDARFVLKTLFLKLVAIDEIWVWA